MKAIVMAQALLPWSGGSAISEASLSANLTRYCEVKVLCRKGAIDYAFARSHGVKEVVQYHPREALEALRNRKHWLNGFVESADIVHLNGHWRWEDHFFARLCRRHSKPYLLQPRGMLLLGHRRVAMKRAYNLLLGNYVVEHAARLIALSRFEVEQFAPYGVGIDRVVVLPNGIPTVATPAATEKIRLPHGEGPFFLYLGRLEARKNLLFLLDVFAEYVRERGGASLLLVGPVERGYDKALQSRIIAHSLEQRAFIMPPIYDPEKWAFLHRARAVIYPTLDEPFGRVPFEAISAGSYPIVPDESGSAEYLRPLLPHCIYRHQDAASLLAVMKGLEATDAQLDATLDKARAWVRDELDWKRIAQVIHSIYQEVIDNKSAAPHHIEVESDLGQASGA